MGPDSWAQRGDTHSIADLANEELEQYDLAFQQARNDRAGGAQLVYTMLHTGELVTADTCQNVVRAIESRVHDKNDPLKVGKVIGDPHDDVWDALRYALYYHHEPEKKPIKMRVQDRLKLIRVGNEQKRVAPEPTAVVQYLKIMREEQQDEEPEYYGVGERSRNRQMQRRGLP